MRVKVITKRNAKDGSLDNIFFNGKEAAEDAGAYPLIIYNMIYTGNSYKGFKYTYAMVDVKYEVDLDTLSDIDKGENGKPTFDNVILIDKNTIKF